MAKKKVIPAGDPKTVENWKNEPDTKTYERLCIECDGTGLKYLGPHKPIICPICNGKGVRT